MALTRKARVTFAVMAALRRLGLAPTMEKLVRTPMDKRLAQKAPKALLGHVPVVPATDRRVTTRDGAQIRVRVYRPEGAAVPLLYLHGGGFMVGGVDSCDHICRRLAAESGAVVCSVEYRLAPEHRFPGPLQDCEDALEWFLSQEPELDPARLVVGGDSAGGNLAAGLALRLREQGKPLAGQLLIYPALDMTQSGEGIRAYRGLGLTAEECRQCADVYLGDGDRSDPFASPLLAPDLTGSAPAFVLTVEHDPLREEGARYAERLQEAGVPTTHLDLLDHVHGSLSVPKLYRGVDEVYATMSAFVRQTSPTRA